MVGVQNEKSFKKNGFKLGKNRVSMGKRLNHHTLTFFLYNPAESYQSQFGKWIQKRSPLLSNMLSGRD